ncbi:hypothetical protein RYH73_14170 [Olivibacter sp. CPCC 100613]
MIFHRFCLHALVGLFLGLSSLNLYGQDSLQVQLIKYSFIFSADSSGVQPDPSQELLIKGGDLTLYYTVDGISPKYKILHGDSLSELGFLNSKTKYSITGDRALRIVGAMTVPDEVTRNGESVYLFPGDFNYEYKDSLQTVLNSKVCQVIVAKPKEVDGDEFWFSLCDSVPTAPWSYFGFLQGGWPGGLLEATHKNKHLKASFGIKAIEERQLFVPTDFFEVPSELIIEELTPPRIQ